MPTRPLADLIAEVLARPDGDREELIMSLEDSFPAPDELLEPDEEDFDPEFVAELQRRIDAARAGTADVVSLEEAWRIIRSDDPGHAAD